MTEERKEANQNTKLWDQVCKTDPKHTKKFTKGGGFSGTAIKPFWLMHRATETFGPCGLGWGWEEIENKMVGGVWCSKVRLWYVMPGDVVYNVMGQATGIGPDRKGHIEQWGQTVMEGTNKHGPFVDEEAPKKAVTDAVTKCLSYLGFAGDVHMGLFDDSKYVREVAAEFDAEPVVETDKAVEIDVLLASKEVDKAAFLAYFKIDDVRKLKEKDYESAKTMLTKKGNRA